MDGDTHENGTEAKIRSGDKHSAHSSGTMSAWKLEESEAIKIAKADESLLKAIMQALTAKK